MANATLERLRNEHRNLRNLLSLLEQQLDTLESGGPFDYQLLADIVDYLVTYPDCYHHPLEDLLFARLIERTPQLRATIDALEEEHPQMAADGVRLRVLISRCADGDDIARRALARLGQRYVDSFRAHMDVEDNGVFDALEDGLTPADWLELTTRFHWTQDPLMADQAEQRFEALRAQLGTAEPTRRRTCGPWSDRRARSSGVAVR